MDFSWNFSDLSRTAENPIIEGLEKKCKKEIRMKKLRRKMVSFKMAWSGSG